MTVEITDTHGQIRPALDFVDTAFEVPPAPPATTTYLVGEPVVEAGQEPASTPMPSYSEVRGQQLSDEVKGLVGLGDEADIAFSGAIRAFEAMSRLHSPARKALKELNEAIATKMKKLDELQVLETIAKRTVEDCDADRQSYTQEQRDTVNEKSRAEVRRDELNALARQQTGSARGRFTTLSVEDQSIVSTQNMIIKQKQRRLDELDELLSDTTRRRYAAVGQLHDYKRKIEVLVREIDELVEQCEPHRQQLEISTAYFATAAQRPEATAYDSRKKEEA